MAIKTEWDLSPIFLGNEDLKIEIYRREIENKVKNFVDKWKNREDYLKNPEILKEALEEFDGLDITGLGGDGVGTKDSFTFGLELSRIPHNNHK
ncbi:MAG: hypothetical protein AABW75_03265 [Nanoarchaeota archaeon]